ncbi:hypothetical protein AB1L07_02275 [Niallia alba]|uniref:hypothetical protein n=1 Tax=Niallia alba TaxID=2729105 RepID=UPI00399F4D46
MQIENLNYEIIIKNGHKYEFVKLYNPFDLTSQNEGIETTIEYVIKGFEEDLYIIFEGNEFYFGHKIGNTGLVVNIEDENIYSQAMNMLFEVLERIN